MISLIEHAINQPSSLCIHRCGHGRNAINRYNDRPGRAWCVAQLPFYRGKYLYCRKLLQCSMSRLQAQLPAICVCNRTIVTPHRRFSQNNRNATTVLIYHASRRKFAPTEDQFVRQNESLINLSSPSPRILFSQIFPRPFLPSFAITMFSSSARDTFHIDIWCKIRASL